MGVNNKYWQVVSTKGIALESTKKLRRYVNRLTDNYQQTPRQRKQYKIILIEHDCKTYVKLYKRKYYNEKNRTI